MRARSVLGLLVTLVLFFCDTSNTYTDMGKFSIFQNSEKLSEIHTHRATTLENQNLTCTFCENSTFKNHAGLNGHMAQKHPTFWQARKARLLAGKTVRRKTYPKKLKRSVVREIYLNPGMPMSSIATTFGIPTSNVSRWYQESFDIDFWSTCRKPRQKVEERAQFCEAERELNERFLHRRKVLGFFVDGHWLRHEMRKFLKVFRPPGWKTFSYSNGWLSRFCTRYRISSQARTDHKSQSVEYRVGQVTNFISEYLDTQKSGPAVDSVFGRFSPDRHWHVDQIPMPFSFPRTRSLNPIGTPCLIKGLGSSALSKRQCSIHLTIRAQGEQIVPPVIIFAGLGKDQSEDEIRAWAELNHVLVYFQKKAWCDGAFFQWYLVNVFNKYVRESGDVDEQLLLLDNLGSHQTERNRAQMKDLGIVPLFLATHCTDVAAPIDHHVGCYLKVKIQALYDKDLEKNYKLWRGSDDDDSSPSEFLDASLRRKKMASWLDAAWGELRVRKTFFLKDFISTGCLITLDGVNGIKMRGLNGPLQEALNKM